MALLSALANSITNFVKGVGAELGIIPGNDGGLYPDIFDEVTTSFNNENWNKLPFPYTFEVVDIKTGSTTSGFAPFALPLAPTKITQTEEFATSIKPTQGGTVVTHSGNRYKKLNIEGTTGINAFRGLTGVDSTTGRAIAKPRELKFMSGYEVANELKNYFKVYYQYKATFPDASRDDRLVFKNFKDGEFLIIEVLGYESDRNADRPLMYDYKIEAKVLTQFKFQAGDLDFFGKLDQKINKIVSKIDVARGIFLGAQEVLRQVESTYDATVLEPMRKIGLAAKALAGIPITAADVGNRIIRNTMTAADSLNILNVIKAQQEQAKSGTSVGGDSSGVPERIQNVSLPTDLQAAVANQGSQTIIDLNDALLDIPLEQLPEKVRDEMVAEVEAAVNNPRSFYEETVTDFKRIKANAEDKFNLGSDEYDALFDRTSTLEGDVGKVVTDEEFSVLGAFNEAITAANVLISYPNLFKSEFSTRIDTINEEFANSLNLQSLPATKTIILPGNTDLERIALDELGSTERWVEIAELNDLNYPYIVQDLSDTRTNIKKPGDTLLVPQNIRFGLSDTPTVKDIPSTDGLSETEKSFGTDLKLTDKMDLDLANNGDLAVISGSPNVAQAIILKIGYERGELKNHPELGVGVLVGEKFLSLEQVRDNLQATLTADKRIESLSNVALQREASALYMSFDVNLKNVDTPIPLKIKL